ncbi:PK beta-barrel-protein domain-containing protein-like protein [Poronia punctata]|nr:PK beta-barrel-protein domain-containing protein-like protein [Poronia punctata]
MDSHTTESALVPTPTPPRVSLLSLRTGKVRPLGGLKVTSAINKQPCQGKVYLTKTGFAGDERQFPPHNSPDNAVHQYNPNHYEQWKVELPDRKSKFHVGAFGENLSTLHLSENNVCVGDKFRLGEAVLQVTMTRQPCFKLNLRFEHKKMSSLAQASGRTGWYYRVLEEGWVEEGDAMELIERINPVWPLSRLQHYLYADGDNTEAMTELIMLPGLSEEMQKLFSKRLEKGAEDMNGRLKGDVSTPWRSYTLVEKLPLTARVQKLTLAADDDDNVTTEELRFDRFPHVRVKFGPDLRFTRAYSVVSGNMKRFELGIARDDNSRGGSVYLHDHLNIGDKIQVAKGHTAVKTQPDEKLHDKKHIFILGGIGVTAFLEEIRKMAEKGVRFEIHYAVRSRHDAVYLDRLPEAQTTIYAKTEGNRLRVKDIIPPGGANNNLVMVYCCGPSGMIEETKSLTAELGYARSCVHFEEFGGAAAGTGDPFEVEIKNTGKILQVPMEKSLLQVLNEAGLDVDSSCLAGNCGSCMVDYSDGEVTHQGVALDEEQKETCMLSCVSRGKGKITIDW